MKWYLGSQNDGLCILDGPSRPSNDDQFHARRDGPSCIACIPPGMESVAAKIVEAHNAALAAAEARLAEVARERDEWIKDFNTLANTVGGIVGAEQLRAALAAAREERDEARREADHLASLIWPGEALDRLRARIRAARAPGAAGGERAAQTPDHGVCAECGACPRCDGPCNHQPAAPPEGQGAQG